jgi:hypothetical protein
MLAWTSLVVGGLLLLMAGALCAFASSGDDWAWVGYYYAAGIAIFEVPAVVLALVALRSSATAAGRGRGRVAAALAALLVPCPFLLWGLWGLSS